MGNNPQTQNSGNNSNNNQSPNQSESMKQQLFQLVESRARNGRINRMQFEEIMTFFTFKIHHIQYSPILGGLYDLVEPRSMTESKPKQYVTDFLMKMATDEQFLEQCKELTNSIVPII